MTVVVFDLAADQEIGVLTDQQFQFLQDHLEEENADDDDYYLNRATLDAFEAEGCDASLLRLLRAAMGTRDEMDIRWERQPAADSAG